jgi:hypothetical protein
VINKKELTNQINEVYFDLAINYLETERVLPPHLAEYVSKILISHHKDLRKPPGKAAFLYGMKGIEVAILVEKRNFVLDNQDKRLRGEGAYVYEEVAERCNEEARFSESISGDQVYEAYRKWKPITTFIKNRLINEDGNFDRRVYKEDIMHAILNLYGPDSL